MKSAWKAVGLTLSSSAAMIGARQIKRPAPNPATTQTCENAKARLGLVVRPRKEKFGLMAMPTAETANDAIAKAVHMPPSAGVRPKPPEN